MSQIRVLDQITIDKIAAGEVIERPASIVKELVENAIDAGATVIKTEIEDGGISLIRISDNGCGIAAEEVRSAFLRHSTSKIRTVDDLTDLSSLGFRGEALSSISAVTRTELITKREEDVFGCRYVIEGGKEISLDETGAPNGTTFLVRQIFYNVPARRKFLKSPSTEAGHIQDLLMRLALSHPEISFTFLSGGQEKLRTSGNGKLKDVIYSVYGRDVAANLIEIDYEKNGIRITGYLGKPVINRSNRNFETFFVNGRYVKSPMISKAVEDAYRDYVMQHKFPLVVLHFHVTGDDVDVNVHPTKMELRFQKPQEVYSTVYEAVHRTLLEPALIQKAQLPTLDSDAEQAKGDSPFLLRPRTRREEAIREEKASYAVTAQAEEKACAPVSETEEERGEDYFIRKMKERVLAFHNRNSAAEVDRTDAVRRPKTQSQRIIESAKAAAQEEKPHQMELFDESFLKRDIRGEYRLVGQVFGTYWLVEYRDSLYIIDQHAAHERVLYEKTLRSMRTREFTSQYISPPIVLSLSMQEAALLEENMDRFTRIGFEIEHFGGEEYAVRAVPDNLFGIAKKELLLDMLDGLTEGISTGMTPELIDEKVASMSCKAAVKGNSRLSPQEMDALIAELLSLDNPYHCPHGRPTIIAMTKHELEKKFKRIV